MTEQKIHNKQGTEITLLPIKKFLSEHHEQKQSLAVLIEKGAAANEIISPSKLQRKCLIGYNKALAMLNALIDSNIATDTEEPREKKISVDEGTAKSISEFILQYTVV